MHIKNEMLGFLPSHALKFWHLIILLVGPLALHVELKGKFR